MTSEDAVSAPLLDAEWLADLCREQHPKILGICRTRLHDDQDALDACQETYTRALLHIEKLKASERPAGWLVETAKRVCHETVRRRQRDTSTRRTGSASGPAPIDDQEAELWREREAGSARVSNGEAYIRLLGQNAADASDRERMLAEAAELVEQLSPTLRSVCRRTLQGDTSRETAVALGITEVAVNLRLLRARRQLAQLIAEQRQQDGV